MINSLYFNTSDYQQLKTKRSQTELLRSNPHDYPSFFSLKQLSDNIDLSLNQYYDFILIIKKKQTYLIIYIFLDFFLSDVEFKCFASVLCLFGVSDI